MHDTYISFGQVFGSKGMLKMEPRLQTDVFEYCEPGKKDPPFCVSFPDRFKEAYVAELDHFIDAIQGINYKHYWKWLNYYLFRKYISYTWSWSIFIVIVFHVVLNILFLLLDTRKTASQAEIPKYSLCTMLCVGFTLHWFNFLYHAFLVL